MPDAGIQRDMLGSFKTHGLTRDEAESETLLQMLDYILLVRER